MNYIYLKKEDIQKFKKIGEGTEGSVYRIGHGVLYKIYHENCPSIIEPNHIIHDKSGVNITPIKDYLKNNLMDYCNSDKIRLLRKDAILRAIRLQKEIKLSKLPSNIIYVDGKIEGCVLHDYSYSTDIYKASYLPKRFRIRIMKQILQEVEELLNHHIYPIDLCQRPTIEYPNTNVLLSYKLKPYIIDLDGQSTLYPETNYEKYQQLSMQSLSTLFLQLYTGINMEDYLNCSIDTEEISKQERDQELLNCGIPESFIEEYDKEIMTMVKLRYYLDKMH